MSDFYTGDKLNDLIEDVFLRAKKEIIIVSPYIKLDDQYKKVLDKATEDHDVHLKLLIGKNEDNIYRSISKEDLDYFKSHSNISILYEPNLHAKCYMNYNEAVITSMNLYDFSANNNVEAGVHLKKVMIGNSNSFIDCYNSFDKIIEEAHCIFIQRPVFKKKLFGLAKDFHGTKTLHDITDDFNISDFSYQKVSINSFQDPVVINTQETKTTLERRRKKPERKSSISNSVNNLNNIKEETQEFGYCIRTREKIPYNPAQPLSRDAYYEWVEWKNMDYSENYCHKTGRNSNYQTSMRKPILNSDYENENIWGAVWG
ncbi:phospholipase D family protein [Nonlabens mediterrranea]|uniref:Phospholipase D family protein n=1 Tax=Nonlabens mediterrranea TaxID=1419947 RepID=A0ABS0A3H7_9FLAO|nr:phospholipase D family protein [Nonlabens mediterrranea]